MKRVLLISGLVAVTTLLNFPASSVSAQANLQSPSNSVQQQTGQTQTSTTTNTQDQTGSLQQNNGQTVLSQPTVRPLGVVSDPKQVTAQSVVQPSSTLKTDITQTNNPSNMKYLIGGLFTVTAFLAVATIMSTRSSNNHQPAKITVLPASKPAHIPELAKPNKPRQKKQTRKQRKKKAS